MSNGGPGPGGGPSGGGSSSSSSAQHGPGYHQQHHHHDYYSPHHHQHHHHDALYRPDQQRQYDARHPPRPPSTSVPDFTPEMRDRQARGKDPDGPGPAPFAFGRAAQSRMALGFMGLETEPFETAQRREKAAAILDNPELLMVYAQRAGDSIPATRMRFMRIMCGYDGGGGGGEGDHHRDGGRAAAPGSWPPSRSESGSSSRHNSTGR
ncbi:hypothetical protein RB595_004575 [Gaeumannomyces hyphopodioides]